MKKTKQNNISKGHLTDSNTYDIVEFVKKYYPDLTQGVDYGF